MGGIPRSRGRLDADAFPGGVANTREAAVAGLLPVQAGFRPDDLRHVRIAARRAGHPFFQHVLVDETYGRTLFAGRGLLFVAHRMVPRPSWRVYLAFFSPLAEENAWFTLLPHPQGHASAGAARKRAEELVARMHTGTWQQALGRVAAREERMSADGA
ncbi:hypothetical protein [Streptomyces melanogenes]|uniref:hypothetical protein n=1 Tax=Streptomyces melanogenes TaxID=67326 RepID=UPI00167E8300|nr:hypothetical protein [Streptomyces melanogenes]GGP90658.1 hypothetical protein GCM10010278_81240 [Streptomyces melanogenes]